MADRNDYGGQDREWSGRYESEHGRDRVREDERWRNSRGDQRGLVERAGDEVRSWFGDEDAARRRHRDELREPGREYGSRDRGFGREEPRGYSGYGSERGYAAGEDVRRSFDTPRIGDTSRDARSDWSRNQQDLSRSDWTRGESPIYRSRQDTDSQRWDPRETQGWTRGERVTPVGYSYTFLAWTEPGPYTGRGPRGYQRSDDRIREDVCDRLTRHGRLDATDIQVAVRSGEVTLEGIVDSREAKRLAEDVAESVDGVREVTNHLKTFRGMDDAPSRATGASATRGDRQDDSTAGTSGTQTITGTTATGSIDKNR